MLIAGEKKKPEQPVIVTRTVEDETKKCPACAETIKLAALKCRFCGHEFNPDEVKRAVQGKEEEIARETPATRFVPQDGQPGEAYCAGCRLVDARAGMLYNAHTDTFYHPKCKPA